MNHRRRAPTTPDLFNAIGAERKHVILPTAVRLPCETSHSHYCHLTAKVAPKPTVTKGIGIGTDGVETEPLTPDLQRLLVAVNTEIDRRRRGASTPGIGSAAPVTGSRPVPVRDEHTNIAEIPEGKANLIRAAFGAGLKIPAIARTFGISLSQVNRVIRSTGKPHR